MLSWINSNESPQAEGHMRTQVEANNLVGRLSDPLYHKTRGTLIWTIQLFDLTLAIFNLYRTDFSGTVNRKALETLIRHYLNITRRCSLVAHSSPAYKKPIYKKPRYSFCQEVSSNKRLIYASNLNIFWFSEVSQISVVMYLKSNVIWTIN